MKKVMMICMGMLLAVNTYALTYECKNFDGQQLNFVINSADKTVTVTNRDALGGAEMVTNTPFSFKGYKHIYFEYDWYYTAWYRFDFKESIKEHNVGDKISMLLSFDDDDGVWDEDVPFSCRVK